MALEGEAFFALADLKKKMRVPAPKDVLHTIEKALASGDCARAQRLCATARKENTAPSVRLCLFSAKAALGVGDTTQATEETHKALQLEPQNAQALKLLGDLTFVAGEEAIAIAYYQQAQERSNSNSLLSVKLKTLQAKTLKRRYFSSQSKASIEPNPATSAVTTTPKKVVTARSLGSADSVESVESPSLVKLPSIEVVDTAVEGVDSASEPEASARRKLKIVGPSEIASLRTEQPTGDDAPKSFERYDKMKIKPVFRTETMARMLLAQGHRQAAIELLQEIVKDKNSPSARATLRELHVESSDS